MLDKVSLDATPGKDSPGVFVKGKPQIFPNGSRHKMIAVLGSHPATVAMTPFKDESVYIMACSPHNFEHRRLPRCEAWCELHKPIAHPTRAYPYLRHLEELPLVWMRDKEALALFPGAKLYPEGDLKKRFGPFFLTSSIAGMLAKAIVDCEQTGIRQIGIWGVMQASKTEFFYQRPSIQNLIWQATKLGIKVVAPDISKLFECPAENW